MMKVLGKKEENFKHYENNQQKLIVWKSFTQHIIIILSILFSFIIA